MSEKPDFLLTTLGESSGPLAEPRACRTMGRLRDQNRDDYMLVEIDPALSGQRYGLGGQEITQLLLSTRLKGQTLFPIKDWPVSVYVTRILDGAILRTSSFTAAQVELIAWGSLYRSLDEVHSVMEK